MDEFKYSIDSDIVVCKGGDLVEFTGEFWKRTKLCENRKNILSIDSIQFQTEKVVESNKNAHESHLITHNVDNTLICSSHKIGRNCFSAGEVELENPERKSIVF